MTIQVINITANRREEWNELVARHPFFALLQSWEWGEFKEKNGWKALRLAVEKQGKLIAGAQILIKSVASGLISLAYVPRGPILDWTDEPVAQALVSAMCLAARQHRAIALKLEPATPYSPELERQLQLYGFRPNALNNHPRCTMLIDLTADDETILARMGKTTRYNIRYSARQGVEIREATEADLDTAYRLLEQTAHKVGVPTRLKRHYQQLWAWLAPLGRLKIFLATYQGEILAMRAPAIFGNIAATFYSSSTDTHKNLKPNELLMWVSMQWTKSQGCTVYDVWGIPDEVGEYVTQGKPLPAEQEGGLWGVYSFKRGFGGEVVYYIGSHDYVYSPLLYGMMNAAISQLGSLDKLARWGDRLRL